MNINVDHLEQSIRRLCHFVPVDKADRLRSTLHQFLVKHGLVQLGDGAFSLPEIRKSISDLFGLNFDEEEIIQSIREMTKSGQVILASKDCFSLDPKCFEELTSALDKGRKLEQHVIEEWLYETKNKYPTLGESELTTLKEDLIIFQTKLFLRHGAQCVSFLYPGRIASPSLLDAAADDIFNQLPHRPSFLHQIRLKEYPLFFTGVIRERRSYIAQSLDATFIIFVLTMDKNCTEIIRETFKGYKLYLDTNFIYRLLGLQGPELIRSAKRVVEISQGLGYQLIVSTKTVQEMDLSISRSVRILKENPLPPRDLAEIGARYTTEKDFLSAYWEKYAQTGISPDDFFAMYKHIDELLAEYDINIKDTLCDKVQQDPALKDEISKLNIVSRGSKHPALAEHDAFHRLLILKLRGKKPPRTFSETKVWFITCDTMLPEYDRFSSQDPEQVPFCILANQWLQAMRPLIPRSDDFDETFVGMFTRPEIRSYGFLPSDIAQKILGRIAQFKNHSSELAVKVLTDRHLINELKETEDKARSIEMIDNATAAAGEEFRKERDNTQKKLEQIRIEAKKLEIDKGKLIKEGQDFERMNKNLQDRIKDLSDSLLNEISARKALEKKILWGITIIIWAMIVVFSIWIVPWKDLSTLKLTIVATSYLLGGIGALIFPLGKRKTGVIFGILAIILTAFGTIFSLFNSLT